MVCLTGNVRHRSYRNVDRRYARNTEVQLALRYCEIAARHHVKVTMFITGKACVEERNGVGNLGRQANAELGGHTFCAFQSVRHWLSRTLGGSALGSASMQRRDIEHTIAAIQNVTGKRITVWRNHASRYDVRTYRLLGACGIRLVSDRITEHTTAVERVSQELLSLPINTLSDHEQLLHGKYTERRSGVAAPWTTDDSGMAGNCGAASSHDRATRGDCHHHRPSPLHGHRRPHARIRATLPVLIAIRNQVGVGGGRKT